MKFFIVDSLQSYLTTRNLLENIIKKYFYEPIIEIDWRSDEPDKKLSLSDIVIFMGDEELCTPAEKRLLYLAVYYNKIIFSFKYGVLNFANRDKIRSFFNDLDLPIFNEKERGGDIMNNSEAVTCQ